MRSTIAFVLSNFTLTLFMLGLVAAALSLAARRTASRDDVIEEVLAFFLLFSIGISFFYNFVVHVFFGAMAARFIGWADSPFQTEVGFASLGFAIVGFAAFRGDRGLRLAAILGPALFLWGAAAGHVREMITAHNFASGNAGVIFYTDILLPLFGFWMLWLRGHVKARPR